MSKKLLITISSILFLLLITAVVCFSFETVWAIVVILPILVLADLCFFTLPVTIPLLGGLTTYSLIKKDYTKFNELYEILLIMIYTGFINMKVDQLLGNPDYFEQGCFWRLYWLVFVLLVLISLIM